MKLAHRKLVVIDPEEILSNEIKSPEHYFFRIHVRAKDRERDAFIVLRSSHLNKFADSLIEECLMMGNLRVVFVRMDTNADVFFHKVQELGKPDLLRKLFRVTTSEQIHRVLQAWWDKRECESIANGYVDQDELIVQSCSLKHYRIRFDDFVGLAELSKSQRCKFKIDDRGNQIFWPGENVSIDLDSIRYKVDENFRREKNLSALSDYEEFLGEAVRKVMRKYRFTQATLKENGGPTERHIYRIEQGVQQLSPTMIERLAKAHGLSPRSYVEELAAACDAIAERKVFELSEH